MTARAQAVARRFHAHDPHGLVRDERMEQPDRVGAAADAGYHVVRQPARRLPELPLGLLADDTVEVPHHHGIWVRPKRRTEQVVRRADAGDPVPEGLVDRILQGPTPGLHGNHPGAEEAHPEDVERLPLDVLGPHVHFALEPQERRGRRGGHAVLPRSRLGNHPPLAHALGQKPLAEHVVDLVGTGVAEVLALQVDSRATAVLGEPPGEVQRRRAARVLGEERPEAPLKQRVAPGGAVGLLQIDERSHQRLGDETPAEAAEVTVSVRQARRALGGQFHRTLLASAMKRRTLAGSFFPGVASTPEFTSTA